MSRKLFVLIYGVLLSCSSLFAQQSRGANFEEILNEMLLSFPKDFYFVEGDKVSPQNGLNEEWYTAKLLPGAISSKIIKEKNGKKNRVIAIDFGKFKTLTEAQTKYDTVFSKLDKMIFSCCEFAKEKIAKQDTTGMFFQDANEYSDGTFADMEMRILLTKINPHLFSVSILVNGK